MANHPLTSLSSPKVECHAQLIYRNKPPSATGACPLGAHCESSNIQMASSMQFFFHIYTTVELFLLRLLYRDESRSIPQSNSRHSTARGPLRQIAQPAPDHLWAPRSSASGSSCSLVGLCVLNEKLKNPRVSSTGAV